MIFSPMIKAEVEAEAANSTCTTQILHEDCQKICKNREILICECGLTGPKVHCGDDTWSDGPFPELDRLIQIVILAIIGVASLCSVCICISGLYWFNRRKKIQANHKLQNERTEKTKETPRSKPAAILDLETGEVHVTYPYGTPLEQISTPRHGVRPVSLPRLSQSSPGLIRTRSVPNTPRINHDQPIYGPCPHRPDIAPDPGDKRSTLQKPLVPPLVLDKIKDRSLSSSNLLQSQTSRKTHRPPTNYGSMPTQPPRSKTNKRRSRKSRTVSPKTSPRGNNLKHSRKNLDKSSPGLPPPPPVLVLPPKPNEDQIEIDNQAIYKSFKYIDELVGNDFVSN